MRRTCVWTAHESSRFNSNTKEDIVALSLSPSIVLAIVCKLVIIIVIIVVVAIVAVVVVVLYSVN